MRRRSIRKLLWLVLVTNLITNVIVLAILVAVVYGVVHLSAPTDEPGFFSSSDYGSVEEAPGGHENVDVPSTGSGDLGIDPGDWNRLLAGEALRDLAAESGRVQVRIRFLVRATAQSAYDLLVDPDNLVELYDDVEAAEVKRRYRGENAAYDTIWFRGRNGPYEIEYCLRRDYESGRSIRWTLVQWPGTSSLLKSCRGGWFFSETSLEGVALLDYRNQLELPDLPDWLLTRMVDHNLPHTMHALRSRLESPGE